MRLASWIPLLPSAGYGPRWSLAGAHYGPRCSRRGGRAAARCPRGVTLARAVVLLLTIAAVLLTGCRPAAPAGSAGTPAPSFTMRQFDGRQTSLADLRGRTLVLNFWASWCVPCREEMPMLEQLSRSERDNGVTVLGVAIEDDELSLTSFLQAFNVTYPAGLDSDNSVARAFEVKGLPTTIVISPTGQIVRRWQGPIDRQRLDSFIAEARAA